MKKFIASLIVLSLLLTCSPLTVCASDSDIEDSLASGAAVGVEIAAKSGILTDQSSGTVLYEKNSHEKMPPASITKIMTMLLVMEAVDGGQLKLEDMVTTSSNAASMGGTQIWLKENEQMSVHDLLKACAVASANDAAMALAEHVGGSEQGFVAMMNNKAAELNMKDTTFVNPTGLDASGHLSCAHDIAVMSRELLTHEKIKEYTSIWMDSLRDGKTELVNTNKLVRFYKGCNGLKTGTTDGAGSCVSVSAARDGLGLISVVMGCTTSKDRFNSAKQLLDYGFSSFDIYTPQISAEQLKPVKVIGGILPTAELTVQNGGSIIIKRGKAKDIVQNISLSEDVGAPVIKGQKLGEIKLSIDGEEIASFSINSKEAIDKITIGNAFGKLFRSYASL